MLILSNVCRAALMKVRNTMAKSSTFARNPNVTGFLKVQMNPVSNPVRNFKLNIKLRDSNKVRGRQPAFNIGQGAVIGASIFGLGVLAYYGLGLSNEPGTDEQMMWPSYVRERIHTKYAYFGGACLVTALSAAAALRSPALMGLMMRNSWFYKKAIGRGVVFASPLALSSVPALTPRYHVDTETETEKDGIRIRIAPLDVLTNKNELAQNEVLAFILEILEQEREIPENLYEIVTKKFDLLQVSEASLDLMDRFAQALFNTRRYSECLDLLKKVWSKQTDLLGENNPKTLESQCHIGFVLFELGKHEESFSLLEENLRKKKNHPDFREDHPKTIKTKQIFATVLLEHGKKQESLQLFQQVFAQQNKIHGENHPETLEAQACVAFLHAALENFPQALDLCQDLEEKQINILGPDHQDLLIIKELKAIVLFNMGKFEAAEKSFKEIYQKKWETLGQHHEDTIDTLRWFTSTLEKQGKLAEALDLCKK